MGKHAGIGDLKNDLGIEIVGVAEDSLYAGPRQGQRPMMYFSYLQANYRFEASP